MEWPCDWLVGVGRETGDLPVRTNPCNSKTKKKSPVRRTKYTAWQA